MNNSDFTQRAAAVILIRDLIRHSKRNREGEFQAHVEEHMISSLSKGLQSHNERVQSEFIEVINECIGQDGRLGSIENMAPLLGDPSDPDLNFLENMKHIQKHRRGRALRRLAKDLEENPDFICRQTKMMIVYPLVRTYIFNEEIISQSDLVQAAIDCIAKLALSFNFKDYKTLLLQFLETRNKKKKTLGKAVKQDHVAPFQKQKVKILAGILNSFHFSTVANKGILKALIDKLLYSMKKMSAGGSEEQEERLDVTLFVPVVKILLLFPEENWLADNLSNLLVNLGLRLKSRLIDERKVARDVLCEMATLLGPDYFSYIVSVLEGSLQRGYQLHVLLYTVNSIVNSICSGSHTGSQINFDGTADRMLSWMESELFGTLQEEKQISALVKKTPESAKVISFGLLEKLGSFTSKAMIVGIIQHLINASLASKSKKMDSESNAISMYEIQEKLRKAVKSFAIGLAGNRNMTREDLLQVSFGILSGQMDISPKYFGLQKELAFSLFQSASTDLSGNISLDQEEVGPFLPFFRKSLDEKDVSVVIGCLKTLNLITTKKTICETILTDHKKEEELPSFLFVITKKCRQYHPMRNKEPYNAICQILRNLLTHDPGNCHMNSEQLKAVCLFFQMCLETNYDDVNAAKLLGLLLLKFYTEEALSSFMRLLCVVVVKAKAESTFNLVKTILGKIVKKHSSVLPKTMAFFIQHLTFELVDGRRRSIVMCQYLLECKSSHNLQSLTDSKSKKKAKLEVKLTSFDCKGLFVALAVQVLNEQDNDCKQQLENLVKYVILLSHLRHDQGKEENNSVFEMVNEWILNYGSDLNVAIGSKILKMYLEVVPVPYDKVQKIVKKLEERLEEDKRNSKISSFVMVNSLQSLSLLVEQSSEEVLSQINFDKVSNLVLYLNPTVRHEALKLMIKSLELTFASVKVAAVGKKRKQGQKTWFTEDHLKTYLNSLCELAKFETREEELIVENMTAIFSRFPPSEGQGQYQVYKKARSIFTHEKFNIVNEESRRLLFYKFVLSILSRNKGGHIDRELLKTIAKHLAKDRKQPFLEEISYQVEKKAQDLASEEHQDG